MTYPHFQWCSPPHDIPPAAWLHRFGQWANEIGMGNTFAALVGRLLWQRGWRHLEAIQGFLDSTHYVPASPLALGDDMKWAIARLAQAYKNAEKVAIWGDFDADGLTATAVLWEGLGQFFAPNTHLRYYVPNRFTESHGLSMSGLKELADWGCTLIVTCDTGSTAHEELVYAETLGMDVIVTDHHTLPETRPPLIALINPRQLPSDHPLAHLSGVAVAYKLLEALYDQLPEVPQQPLETVLDLVAIGLIADLVALRGDCRYLTQVGLKRLETQAKLGVRPGIAKLLEFCKRTGDRPSDIAFGIGPRINAVSRIHGNASFGVELLTSRDRPQAEKLALEAELANTRRKDLQASVMRQATAQLAALDLSTTQVIILSDPQWSPGVLGLVASQIAQQHGRPTILFQTETTAKDGQPLMARGSARSVNQIDLYELVKTQAHLLTSFGGHPLAAGMSLPVTNLPLFAEGLNRAVRSQFPMADLTTAPPLNIDLEVSVADLGKELFRALKFLEPYGMGNPVPRLLLSDIQVTNLWETTLKDRRGGKQRYYKLAFDIVDPRTEVTFPGHWWGHRRSDLPEGRYNLVIELDVNTYKKRYEARLIDLQPIKVEAGSSMALPIAERVERRLIDQRDAEPGAITPPAMLTCPTDWSDFAPYRQPANTLTLAYASPQPLAPETQWQQLLGIAKYLARTGESRPTGVIAEKVEISDRTLQIGLRVLEQLGYDVDQQNDQVRFTLRSTTIAPENYELAARPFLSAIQEESFRRQYFAEVSTDTLKQVLGTLPIAGEPH
ncbi:single-stranded-DNA-specific exonuclease RecJ [Oscillatoria sp. CS-180]|uniref:single-stranded-DNA-specific exonuclease RecJ n=1 Tax=Oscillatoria sp. CS-180 TaxID=3021720 RepID=UPI00232EFB0D|nr:single-stranded-DNA-specific exonuclease RecJ [Oscillatoria sp. CS-180]MDB9528183.1 single-stranded-DNA-specific exonuclease RecJ [Oscillatoria sp. CS-180]